MGEKSLNYFNQRLDQILVGTFLGANILGYYTLAYNIAITPFLRINPILTKVAFPAFSKVQTDNRQFKNGYFKLINTLTTINFPLLIGLAVLASDLIPVVFGPGWKQSIILLQLFCVVALI